MKAFVISLCVFVLVLAVSVFAAIYTVSACRVLAAAIPAISETADPAEFRSLWQKKRPFIRYTVGHTESELVDDALDEWSARYEDGSESDIRAAIEKLSAALERIRRSESFTADTLF